MMDAIDPWLRAFGGVVLLCTGALLPLARRLLVRDDWTAILRRPRRISATPALFAFDPAAALLGTLLGAGIGIMASLAQIVLIIIVRRAP
jgi:hypothetical protein